MSDKPPPTAFALAFASALIAGFTGYFIGQASAIGVFGGAKSSTKTSGSPGKNRTGSHTPESSSDDDFEEIDEAQELGEFAENKEECKLVLVVRTDLGMTKGKIAAQCGHATLACYKSFLATNPQSPLLARWERYGQMKVALQVKSQEEMETLEATAISLGLCARTIQDAGRTQIASGSKTVLGIGPGPRSVIDQVTGHLKLL